MKNLFSAKRWGDDACTVLRANRYVQGNEKGNAEYECAEGKT